MDIKTIKEIKILEELPKNLFNTENNVVNIVPVYITQSNVFYLVGPIISNSYKSWERFDRYKARNGLQSIVTMLLCNEKIGKEYAEKLINNVDNDLRKTIDLVESNW